MGEGFPILKAGSSNGEFISWVNEKYVDRPLSSLKPFPTIFKWSILRRIKGLELIYRRAIPSLVLEMRSLTRPLNKKIDLNKNYLINISFFVPPSLNLSICSPEGSPGRVVHSRDASNLHRGSLEEREKSSSPDYRLQLDFQRGFAAVHGGLQQRNRTAHQVILDLEEADRLPIIDLAGQGQIITHKASVTFQKERIIDVFSQRSDMVKARTDLERTDRLPMTVLTGGCQIIIQRQSIASHEEKFRDRSSQRSDMGKARTGLERTDRLPMIVLTGSGQMIIHRQSVASHDKKFRDRSSQRSDMSEARTGLESTDRMPTTLLAGSGQTIGHIEPTIIHGAFPGSLGEGPDMGANSTIIGSMLSIVRRELASVNKPSTGKEHDLKRFAPQTFKTDVENSRSIEFAESLRGAPILSDPRKMHQRYPEMEHIESIQTKIVKERVVLNEKTPKLETGQQFIDINLNRISDQVYSMIERQIRIERERRGLYG